jgi:hypothetical protein
MRKAPENRGFFRLSTLPVEAALAWHLLLAGLVRHQYQPEYPRDCSLP